ncbi:MAG: hypothetical protein EXX96DRAFT_571043 [Benjaminiella poitrasii]|nr:MAG: hypothetical protein EXX96DRAFT_571043 [Benjaminiella poitrasii]
MMRMMLMMVIVHPMTTAKAKVNMMTKTMMTTAATILVDLITAILIHMMIMTIMIMMMVMIMVTQLFLQVHHLQRLNKLLPT